MLRLIGGTGRSGTTILKLLFEKHSRVAIIPESRITLDPDGLVDYVRSLNDNWSPYLFHRKTKRLIDFLNSLKRPENNRFLWRILSHLPQRYRPRNYQIRIDDYCKDYETLVAKLESELVEFSYEGRWIGNEFAEPELLLFKKHDMVAIKKAISGFYGSVMDSILSQASADYFVEDNTWNIIHYDTLYELFPHGNLVHILRDPRDVVASYVKQSWMPSDPVESAHIVSALLDRWNMIKVTVPVESYKEVSLYRLVDRTRIVLGEICDFWEMPWEEALLSVDLNASNRGRWKNDISNDKIQKVAIILEKHIEAFELLDGNG